MIRDKSSWRYVAENLDTMGVMERSVDYGSGTFYQKLSRQPDLVICGGGHVALALCTEAKRIGFRVTVIDDRAEFANKQRFSSADDVICGDFREILEGLSCKNVWYAVMTRGHSSDEICVECILSRPYQYLGMMGSKSKVAFTRNILLSNGFTEERISSIHAPIGLPIGAQTPEEIAVSIVAELISVRSKFGHTFADNRMLAAIRNNADSFVVVSIIDKSGSAPRGEGSSMAVFTDGTTTGTIGGGKVEAEVLRNAQSVIGHCSLPFVRRYDLSDSSVVPDAKSDEIHTGMICGGSVTVLFEPVESAARSLSS
jgi:xanthine dehydrogenase accessory factor